MHNTVKENFRTALRYYLEQDGRGAQSKLCRLAKINPGYLSSIVKGTQPGSDEAKDKICRYFGVSYEYMLILGRWINDGKEPEQIPFLPETAWNFIKKQYSDFSAENDEQSKNRENIIAFKAALKEYVKEHPENINMKEMHDVFKISGDDARSLLEEFPVEPNIDIETTEKIAQYINKSLYEMIAEGRCLIYGLPLTSSTLLRDVLKDEKGVQKVISSLAPHIGEGKAELLACDLIEYIADKEKKFLSEEYEEEIFSKFGLILLPKELEDFQINKKIYKTDKEYSEIFNFFKKTQSAYLCIKEVLIDPKFNEFQVENEEHYEKIEKNVNSIIPSMGALAKKYLARKSFPLPENVANEIDENFKPWSDECARFIWEKGCEQAGLPSLFDSQAELAINAYKKQLVDDVQLYKGATIWADQKKQEILSIKKKPTSN